MATTVAIPVKGLRVSVKSRDTAIKNNYYIHVSDKNKAPSRRTLSGAPRVWNRAETANDVYSPSTRLSGSRENVLAAIRLFNTNFAQSGVRLDDSGSDWYTRENTMRGQARHQAFINEANLKTPKQYDPTVIPLLVQISDAFANNGRNGVETYTIIDGEGVAKVKRSKSPKGTKRGKAFLAKFSELPRDGTKAVNVSSMGPDTYGTSVQSVAKDPKSLAYAPSFPYVSSSNQENYTRALRLLIDSKTISEQQANQYAAEFSTVLNRLRASGPTAPRAPSGSKKAQSPRRGEMRHTQTVVETVNPSVKKLVATPTYTTFTQGTVPQGGVFQGTGFGPVQTLGTIRP